MSRINCGVIEETEVSKNSKGGTEQMRNLLWFLLDKEILQDVVIHCSWVDVLDKSKKNILWIHDLPSDGNFRSWGNRWKEFDAIVFVSQYQRDLFHFTFAYDKELISRSHVIRNSARASFRDEPLSRFADFHFVYHTTPHRGLHHTVSVVDALYRQGLSVHLDVFSSFKTYGWSDEYDQQFSQLFEFIEKHEAMTNHGYQHQGIVDEHLKRADIFLYPSIHVETSCLSLMEAIVAKALPVIPYLGALAETAMGQAVIFNPGSNIAQSAYETTLSLVENGGVGLKKEQMKLNPDLYLTLNGTSNRFKSEWYKLIKEIKNAGHSGE